MMALAAPRADAPRASCPACAAGGARPAPSAFPQPLLSCPSCGHRWVAEPGRHEPPAAFYDDLHERDLINAVPADERRAMLDDRLRLVEQCALPAASSTWAGDGAFLARAGRAAGAPSASRPRPRPPRAPAPWSGARSSTLRSSGRTCPASSTRSRSGTASSISSTRGRPCRPWAPACGRGASSRSRCPTAPAPRRGCGGAAGATSTSRATATCITSRRRRCASSSSALAAVRVDVRTEGSVDLRHVPGLAGVARRPGGTWALDRASGVLARAGKPARLGSTLLLRAQKGPADG